MSQPDQTTLDQNLMKALYDNQKAAWEASEGHATQESNTKKAVGSREKGNDKNLSKDVFESNFQSETPTAYSVLPSSPEESTTPPASFSIPTWGYALVLVGILLYVFLVYSRKLREEYEDYEDLKKETEKAQKTLDQRKNWHKSLQEGSEALSQGDYTKAQKSLEKALADSIEDRERGEVFHTLGKVFLKKSKTGSVETTHRGVSSSTTNDDLHTALAYFEEAAFLLEENPAMDLENDLWYFDALQMKGDTTQAQKIAHRGSQKAEKLGDRTKEQIFKAKYSNNEKLKMNNEKLSNPSIEQNNNPFQPLTEEGVRFS